MLLPEVYYLYRLIYRGSRLSILITVSIMVFKKMARVSRSQCISIMNSKDYAEYFRVRNCYIKTTCDSDLYKKLGLDWRE